MPLPAIEPSTIGGGSPNATTLSTNPLLSTQITSNLASQPASPVASPLVSAMALKTPQIVPQSEPESGLANVPVSPKNKYDDQFDEAQGLLSKALEEKKGISPTALALSRGFFAPTKSGSFGETLYLSLIHI